MSGKLYLNQPFIKDGETASHANANITGNYTTATDYVIKPTTDQVFLITRVILSIEDVGAFDAAKYGNAIVLTNGWTMQFEDADEVINQLIPTYMPVKTNSDIGDFCFDVDVKKWGVGNEILLARWTFAKGGIEGIKLSGRRGEKLVATFEDDYTGLVSHHIIAQGHKYTVA